jgi:hypothetical protein
LRQNGYESVCLSSNGRLWVAEQSDHGDPLRQPDIVVDAIADSATLGKEESAAPLILSAAVK